MNILKRLLHLGNAGELETVFNHNITEDELIFLGMENPERTDPSSQCFTDP